MGHPPAEVRHPIETRTKLHHNPHQINRRRGQNYDRTNRTNEAVTVPKDPTIRSPLLRLPAMRRTDAPGLGRTKQQVRRNVPRLRRLLTPKISRRRQPTEALLIMITERM
jgi:hypothetical protein